MHECWLCRLTGGYIAAVEQYELAASIGNSNKDPAYKELDIMVANSPRLQSCSR